MATPRRFTPLPGSTGATDPDFRDPQDANLSAGRWSEAEIIIMGEMVQWWRHRRAAPDSIDPLETLIGGMDQIATCTTTGTFAETVATPKTLVIQNGASYFCHAMGIPADPEAAGEVYSIVSLLHFYVSDSLGFFARSTQIARAPAGTTSTEIRAVVSGSPPGSIPIIQVTGVTGLTINWKVELYRLEIA
jgi:hypothetical protein